MRRVSFGIGAATSAAIGAVAMMRIRNPRVAAQAVRS
jgi:hypothetical protein